MKTSSAILTAEIAQINSELADDSLLKRNNSTPYYTWNSHDLGVRRFCHHRFRAQLIRERAQAARRS